MISIQRLTGFFLRHLYPLRRDFDLLSDMLYWPLIDVVLWGVTSQWLVSNTQSHAIISSILVALILWQVIWRSQSEVARNLIEEIWNTNLVNLFSSPLSLTEWTIGVLLLSILKMSITVSVVSLAIFALYHVSLIQAGWWIIPFFISTMMTGWWTGFIAASVVILHGPRMQSVVWTLPGVLLPFSAVYFPLSQLPWFLQPISRLIPTTYIFEGLRSQLATGSLDWSLILMSLVLNCLYLAITILFFRRCFFESKKLGLGRFN
jgi:ABC-2 type transport system permease protein